MVINMASHTTPTPREGHSAPANSAELAQNLALVEQRILTACAQAGRSRDEVRLLPVSKTKPANTVRLAHELGLTEFGENRPQEAHQKWQETQDLPGLRWSVIGHLQRNKAGLVAECASEFQALDSLRVAEALDRRLQTLGRSLDVLVQVNTSGEDSKFGLPPQDLAQFLPQLSQFTALRVRGLMTLAIFSHDHERVRTCFQTLHTLRDQLRQNAPQGMSLDELSMGMSGDLDVAIAEGSTTVRVGQAIFGARQQTAGHYWPGVKED